VCTACAVYVDNIRSTVHYIIPNYSLLLASLDDCNGKYKIDIVKLKISSGREPTRLHCYGRTGLIVRFGSSYPYMGEKRHTSRVCVCVCKGATVACCLKVENFRGVALNSQEKN